MDKGGHASVSNKAITTSYTLREKDLEAKLIEILQAQGYEYVHPFRDDDLPANLRRQLEKLNGYHIPNFRFTDSEWRRFYRDNFEGSNNQGIEVKNAKIQGNEVSKMLERDDGREVNIDLFDRDELYRNQLQVINQFIDRQSNSRYDVTILVNGLPLVHIEIKNRGISLKDAFNQIAKYQIKSFHDLFEFIQIFIISNGEDTRYYSNATEYTSQNSGPEKSQSQNSFLFTSHWTHPDNTPITDLIEFAQTFLARDRLLSILANYCALDNKNQLKVLRPYQIAAIEAILKRINFSIKNRFGDSVNAGGYIWHTTGSGKTLTSFKAAQLAKNIPEVQKVIFVVDRKDLNQQTILNYRSYLGKDSDATTQIYDTANTEALRRLLDSKEKQIIVTTVQKLRRLLKQGKYCPPETLKKGRVVVIMDECHRSQTQETHNLIASAFKNRNVFGFTGTPIFHPDKEKTQAPSHHQNEVSITEEIFGDQLHTYTIIDAINDNNVLKFCVHYMGGKGIAWSDPEHYKTKERIEAVVRQILRDFRRKTTPTTTGDLDQIQESPYNSMFATASIDMAIDYYKEFKKQMKEGGPQLKVALIYSATQDKVYVNENNEEEEPEDNDNTSDTEGLNEKEKTYMSKLWKDYEQMFDTDKDGSKFSIDNFEQYRSSVSEKTRNKEIDILIVVNMFLTGFDAPTLNTLWVDKNLKEHGLIQAFSRTNRTHNRGKPHGNIVCFRDIKEQVDEALTMFAGPGSHDTVCVESYEIRVAKFRAIEDKLMSQFPLGKPLENKEQEMEFVNTYKDFLTITQSLSGEEAFNTIRRLRSDEREQYRTMFLDIKDKYRKKIEGQNQEGQVVDESEREFFMSFDWELIRVDDITIAYILQLLKDYWQKKGISKQAIIAKIKSSSTLREKEPLLVGYMDEVDKGRDIDFADYKGEQLEREIQKIIEENKLKPEGVKTLFKRCFDEDRISLTGAGTRKSIMPPDINPIRDCEKWSSLLDKIKLEMHRILNMFKDFK